VIRRTNITHEFVETIPENLQHRTLYISIPFATAVHRCCCGCGNEVVTPLTPTDWELSFNGETVSLYPSIGNWSLPCKSHYWITRGEVRWGQNGRINRFALEEVAIAGRRTDSSGTVTLLKVAPSHSRTAKSKCVRWCVCAERNWLRLHCCYPGSSRFGRLGRLAPSTSLRVRLFRVLCERVGGRDLVFLFQDFESLKRRGRCSHPCKERKDGAPSVAVASGKKRADQAPAYPI